MTADVFAGNFPSQPVAFAHLWDVAQSDFIADGVEVICNTDPAKRLRHYFSEADARKIEDGLGLRTTCIIVFATAGLDIPSTGTDRLAFVGNFPILRIAPGQQ